jgi:hypothetical protein
MLAQNEVEIELAFGMLRENHLTKGFLSGGCHGQGYGDQG